MKLRLLPIIFVLGLLLSVIISLVHPDTALASKKSDIAKATFKFQNKANIQGDFGPSGKINFVDRNTSDSIYNYAPTSGNFCNPVEGSPLWGITLQDNPDFGASSIRGLLAIGYKTVRGHQVTCHDASRAINVKNPNRIASYDFKWDGNNITTFNNGQQGATFAPAVNDPTGRVYIDSSTSGDSCAAAIVLKAGSASIRYQLIDIHKGNLYIPSDLGDDVSNLPQIKNYFPSSCKFIGPIPVTIAGTRDTSPPGGPGSGGGEAECGAKAGFSLSWIMCPIIEGAQETASAFYSEILEPLLKEVPIDTERGTGDYASYTAWQSFRILANIMLVGVMLILVYGMIRGGGGGR